MNSSCFFQLPSYILIMVISLLVFLFNWLGFIYKKRQIQLNPEAIQGSMGSIEGSVLGIMSLLLGFTFSLSVSKFETRRNLTIEEANDIGTAILRCDMYPDSVRNPLRADIKEYLETRIAYYTAGNDEEKINKEIKKAGVISGRIWKRVIYHSNNLEFRVRSQQMIPVVNAMIDIVTTRDAMRTSRIPLILWTLLMLALTAAFLLGSDYKGRKRNKLLVIVYALVMTLTLNLIIELNKPREGLLNSDLMEKKITDLRDHFN